MDTRKIRIGPNAKYSNGPKNLPPHISLVIFMDEFEVSHAQYRTICAAALQRLKDGWDVDDNAKQILRDVPTVNVTGSRWHYNAAAKLIRDVIARHTSLQKRKPKRKRKDANDKDDEEEGSNDGSEDSAWFYEDDPGDLDAVGETDDEDDQEPQTKRPRRRASVSPTPAGAFCNGCALKNDVIEQEREKLEAAEEKIAQQSELIASYMHDLAEKDQTILRLLGQLRQARGEQIQQQARSDYPFLNQFREPSLQPLGQDQGNGDSTPTVPQSNVFHGGFRSIQHPRS